MTPDPEAILLVGGGGHCRSVIDVLEAAGRRIAGVVERPGSGVSEVLGHPVLGTDEDLPALARLYRFALITVGQLESPQPRMRLAALLKELGFSFPAVASPLARVSPHASLGQGTVVHHFAVVNAGARVGAHCILNTRALVEHDAAVGDFCHVSTGAVLNGGTSVGEGCFIGSGAICRDNISIGAGCFVAMGVRVLAPLAPGARLTPGNIRGNT
ncbi:acetyltransferase [Fundidesulfovibrio soli]|uniref:acetyltransferase n=1 Tax=Fundidesulfovibrio soli TaxID=2922716 RepID=UPI001FAF962F|nr:acetyltransferase [Fundidesulfovibrio soli]